MGSSSVGRYIAVYGPSGSGKTTLSRELGRRLGLPVIELDAVMHGPNWQDLETEEFRARVRQILDAQRDGWIIDGNYAPVRDLILEHADAAVWLRLPFRVVYPRLVSRTLRRLAIREELWNGNTETFRLSFMSRESILLWGVTNWRPHHRNMRAGLRQRPPGVQLTVLKTPRDVRRWLAALPEPLEAAEAAPGCRPS